MLFVCVATTAMAQGKRISGNVWNALDGPVVMANVLEIDANQRIVSQSVTDLNGNFSMTIKSPKNRLKISYVGYETFLQVIGDRTSFKIELKDKNTLTDVVVVAKKRVKTNGLTIPEREVSVAQQTLNMDDLAGLQFTDASEALQGKIAGLDIVANSGNLGSGTTMRLRGVTTINGNAEPLIVVDGNIFDLPDDAQDLDFENMDNEEQFSTLLSVNPEDILSINVLKDASATAIWGSKGANGVIEIKTRRGSRGKTKVNFSYRFTGSWQPSGMTMLDGDGYTKMLKEAYYNPRQDATAATMKEIEYDQSWNQYYNFNKNTDWRDEVTQFGQSHSYYLTVSGGGEKANFRISGGYDKQTGTIIEQALDRFSTRMVLDYFVSDRIKFSSNFALTYTDNKKNWDGSSTTSILSKAYSAMPNMSIYEYDAYGNLTGDYYKMLPSYDSYGSTPNGYSSKYLSDMRSVGNPVAIAKQAWQSDKTYRLTPQFQIEYQLMGLEDDQTQLKYTGEVYLDAFSESIDSYYPATLTTSSWSEGVNLNNNSEYQSLAFTTRHSLIFTPHFNNEDWFVTAMARWELKSGNSTSQYLNTSGAPAGLETTNIDSYLTGVGSSTGQWRSMAALGTIHASYKSKYSLDFTLRADGSTKYGAGNKWGYFPGLSARWNISDEKFMSFSEKWLSMLAARFGWGIVGNEPSSEYTQYNRYASYATYAGSSAISPQNLKLTALKWEKTTSWNIGFNLGLFKDLITFDLNIYNKKTEDLLMKNRSIPMSTGYSTLSWSNVGTLKNKGWELFATSDRIMRNLTGKKPKFDFGVNFNFAQNINTISDMDATVLASINTDYNYNNMSYLNRIQIGNAVGSIYGFRYKGVYRYDYDHSGYTTKSQSAYGVSESGYNSSGEAIRTAQAAELRGENATCPIARDANGNIIYDASGNPLPMYFNYGGVQYQFQGGDVIYEDVNHDGQINELDIVYLGNSNPKFNGGFGINLYYGRFSLKTSFNLRVGNKIINMARMTAENMRSNNNQSAAVNWRWRKNGDITEIPRALNAGVMESYNALANSRYVEDGDFVRFQYLQLSYSFEDKLVKSWGLSSLRLSLSGNNLWFWSKYKGVDPEHSAGSWGVCTDNSQTPRSKSFTLSLNVGF
jgi:TonB-linked SusC/RagA family outer membrane protein